MCSVALVPRAYQTEPVLLSAPQQRTCPRDNLGSSGHMSWGRKPVGALYSGSEDGTVKIWDLRAQGPQREYESRGMVNTVVLHPNQGELISGTPPLLEKTYRYYVELRSNPASFNSVLCCPSVDADRAKRTFNSGSTAGQCEQTQRSNPRQPVAVRHP